MIRAWIVILGGLLVSGCGSSEEASVSSSIKKPKTGSSAEKPRKGSSCGQIEDQRKRDVCFYDQLVAAAADQSEVAIAAAHSINDPVIKSAGVVDWIRAHNRAVSVEDGQKLCDQLENWERTACERRLYAAHLQR